jgi:hypothetical protein
MGLSTFLVGGQVWLYILDEADLPFGGRELFWWCQKTVVTDHEHEPKEREKKSEERIEESGRNVRGSWLICDREEQMAIEELKGAKHEWSFWEGPEAVKD